MLKPLHLPPPPATLPYASFTVRKFMPYAACTGGALAIDIYRERTLLEAERLLGCEMYEELALGCNVERLDSRMPCFHVTPFDDPDDSYYLLIVENPYSFSLS